MPEHERSCTRSTACLLTPPLTGFNAYEVLKILMSSLWKTSRKKADARSQLENEARRKIDEILIKRTRFLDRLRPSYFISLYIELHMNYVIVTFGISFMSINSVKCSILLCSNSCIHANVHALCGIILFDLNKFIICSIIIYDYKFASKYNAKDINHICPRNVSGIKYCHKSCIYIT